MGMQQQIMMQQREQEMQMLRQQEMQQQMQHEMQQHASVIVIPVPMQDQFGGEAMMPYHEHELMHHDTSATRLEPLITPAEKKNFRIMDPKTGSEINKDYGYGNAKSKLSKGRASGQQRFKIFDPKT